MAAGRDPGDPSESTAALLVAAGAASRMGRPKALLPWGDESLLRHVVEVALESSCGRTFVVLGSAHAAHEHELHGLEVTIVRNRNWEAGLGSSIAAGIAAIELADEWQGVLLLLCDQPFVSARLLDALIAARRAERAPMAACRYADTVGPPAVFERSLFGELRELDGDRGAKALLLSNPARVATVDFPDGEFDIDTPGDYDRALGTRANRGSGST